MIYSRNNVWAGTDYALHNYNETQPIDFDHDDLYTSNSEEFVYWGDGPDRHMHDLATFQTLTGQELHGLNVEPGFADADGGDYGLDGASELIDAGIVIPGINDAYLGSAPDIGAFEYADGGFALTVAPASRAITPGGVATYTLDVQPIGGFTGTVTLSAAIPSPRLRVSLNPGSLTPPDRATLTLTDTHTDSTLLPGRWYSLPVTASGDGLTQVVPVGLLVGGARVYLPVAVRE